MSKAKKLKTFLLAAKSQALYLIYLFAIIAVTDVVLFHNILGFGYQRHYEQENILRYPAPYVEFTGKPNADGHNKYGFRGHPFDEASATDLKIAFFGGSTGYMGEPPIPEKLEEELTKLLGTKVFVANYSVVSSNHSQHLHGIVEFLPKFQPDIVIFYGGYNETMQYEPYDPRPGYPYNYFYRAETKPLIKILLENSAIIGEFDSRTNILTGLAKLRKNENFLSEEWKKKIVAKYISNLELAHQISGTLKSNKFGHTKFFAFYQPYQVSENFLTVHDNIKNDISKLDYVFDVSSHYKDSFAENVYTDVVHVEQKANDSMAIKIAQILAKKIRHE